MARAVCLNLLELISERGLWPMGVGPEHGRGCVGADYRREHDDGYGSEPCAPLHGGHEIPTVHVRHSQIEDHDTWEWLDRLHQHRKCNATAARLAYLMP